MNADIVISKATAGSQTPVLPSGPAPKRTNVLRLTQQFEQLAIKNTPAKKPIKSAIKRSPSPGPSPSLSPSLSPSPALPRAVSFAPIVSPRARKSSQETPLAPVLPRPVSLAPPVPQDKPPLKNLEHDEKPPIKSLVRKDILSKLPICGNDDILCRIAQFALEGPDLTHFEKSSQFCLNRQISERLKSVRLNIYRGSGSIGTLLFQHIFTNRRVLNLQHYLATTPTLALGETVGGSLLSRQKAWLHETMDSIKSFRIESLPYSPVKKAKECKIELISRFSKLEVLELPNISLSAAQLTRLQALPLTCLAVACDKEGVSAIAKIATLYRLSILDYNKSIDDEAIDYLPFMKGLRHLFLQNCKNITNHAMSSLATMPLESLSLRECIVTSLGIRILSQIESLKTLVIRIYENIPSIYEFGYYSMEIPEEDTRRHQVMMRLKNEKPELEIDLQQTYRSDAQVDRQEVFCCGQWSPDVSFGKGDGSCCVIM
jgi:hypothetical protein